MEVAPEATEESSVNLILDLNLVTDTPDTLDFERMAHVVTGVYALLTTP